ncbi:MAG TPA: pyridoxamine 5'-phosphate oxidase [Streptosporangiaceae bacterium]|nr:pyridoxamine 5'-phosphate oxidase [Streptosporangiaceae bacterium]
METPKPAALRRAYANQGLDEAALAPDPIEQFGAWFADAVAAGLPEPNAMVLATASADAVPNARTVLLKGYGPEGFRFFTNYTSRKGRELRENPRACLVFPWHALQRQVVVTGTAARLSDAEAADYFRSRPYGSRLGAWASRQSSVLPSRAELESRYAALAARWPEDADVPVPDFWGGYLVTHETVEFWQGRANRLHDRLRYVRAAGSPGEDGSGWVVERLSP